MVGAEIIPEKLLFMGAMLALFGITGYKLYNVMHKAEKYEFPTSALLFAASMLCFAFCMVVYINLQTNLTLMGLYWLTTRVVWLNGLLWFIEIILYIMARVSGQVRERHTPDY